MNTSQGEVCVALEAAVRAVPGLVDHLGDEFGGERDYEALWNEIALLRTSNASGDESKRARNNISLELPEARY